MHGGTVVREGPRGPQQKQAQEQPESPCHNRQFAAASSPEHESPKKPMQNHGDDERLDRRTWRSMR